MDNKKKYNDYESLKGIVTKCNPYHHFDFADDIEDDIICHIMECEEEDNSPEIFFEQVIQYGCRNGATNMFMYNDESRDFYVKHMDSMEDFMIQYEEEYDITMVLDRKIPRYIQVCWFCYEELARAIYENMFPEKQ